MPIEDNPLAALARARASLPGRTFRLAHRSWRPPIRTRHPGGDLDYPSTLPRVLRSAAADGEVMLLCMGNDGTQRQAANLVLSLRAMGLYHMLTMAPDRNTCAALWRILPSLACVWWPSQFAREKPRSLYNNMFSRTALAFFEARKQLLERLVLHHRCNVFHVDGDTIFFANPYVAFKTLYQQHNLIVQTDNPFANAGVFYLQNVKDGDAASWVLKELNRRIARFTYRPESVQQLPNSAWASAPPYFANADEQANLNDVIASSLSGMMSFSGGVEFMEARFRERFAPRKCFAPANRMAHGDKTECAVVSEARKLMHNLAWTRRLNEGGAVAAARRVLRGCGSDQGFRYRTVTHLCQRRGWASAREGLLQVPGNASAPQSKLALAPAWLFSHFPYGSFFDDFRRCHDSGWNWAAASVTERRLCMPEHRVPAFMVHLAGLRQESWGRRTLMRALGVWQDAADAVAPEAWVSARGGAAASAAMAAEPEGTSAPARRTAAWRAGGRLLVTEGLVSPTEFSTMGDYDRFAARLLLLGLLLRRRTVMPPIACALPFMQKALQARHLRGMEVGCGASSQCVWLPYPHHIEPWCAGIDFLWDLDYRSMITRGEVKDSELAERQAQDFHLGSDVRADSPRGTAVGNVSAAALLATSDAPTRVLVLRPQNRPTASDAGGLLARFKSRRVGKEAPLGWLPLGGFRTLEWKAPFPRRLESSLRAPEASGGLGLSNSQVVIVKTCLKSLATSRE